MSLRELILQGLLAWVQIGAVAPSATALTDAQVIFADQSGPRPPRPYLMLKLTVYDVPEGEDEELDDLDGGGNPIRTVTGERSGTVSVHGFGEAAEGWLETLGGSLRRAADRALIEAAGLTIVQFGGVQDLTARRDASMEPHFLREFRLAYRFVGDPETLIELANVEVDLDTTGAAPLHTDIDFAL